MGSLLRLHVLCAQGDAMSRGRGLSYLTPSSFVRTRCGMGATKRGGQQKAAKKDAHLNIRLTSEQRGLIGTVAAKAGISASSWVLLLALREAKEIERRR